LSENLRLKAYSKDMTIFRKGTQGRGVIFATKKNFGISHEMLKKVIKVDNIKNIFWAIHVYILRLKLR
jgi:hypothetical protein